MLEVGEGDDWRGTPQQRFHRQPLPDFMRWIASKGELPYLPYELRMSLPVGKWDSVPGCYLPSHCLEVAWVTEDEVVRFFHKKEREVEKATQDAIKREQWKEDRLYAERKDTLVSMCRERNVEPSGIKYEIVERLASALNEEKPREPQLFDGTKKLPKSPKDIGRLPISYLQSIVKYHGLVPCGTKDELALRVCLISNNRKYLCSNRVRKTFLELISVTRDVILEERKQLTLLEGNNPFYRHRTYTTPIVPSLSSDRPRYHASIQTEHSVKSRIELPPNVTMENVHNIFEELVKNISVKRETPQKTTPEQPKANEDGIAETTDVN